jgi:hypothetical protein
VALPLALAVALASAVGPDSAGALRARAEPLAQEEWGAEWEDEDGGRRRRLRLIAWGGEALESSGSGRSSTFFGGEVGWAFEALDLGLAAYGYRDLSVATREWTPVVLARITQRFRTHRGIEAAFGFGLGAGQPRGWRGWYQLALGMRVPLGPLFLAGELAFEQYDLLRLGAGLGVAF